MRIPELVEKAGIHARAIDLANPSWGDLPDDFTLVLHLAAVIVPGHDGAIRINAEGTGRVMQRHRSARACLMMSTCDVHLSPEDGDRPTTSGRASATARAISRRYTAGRKG